MPTQKKTGLTKLDWTCWNLFLKFPLQERFKSQTCVAYWFIGCTHLSLDRQRLQTYTGNRQNNYIKTYSAWTLSI